MEKLRFQPDRVHGKDFLPRRQYQHPALTLEPGFPNGGEVYFGTAESTRKIAEKCSRSFAVSRLRSTSAVFSLVRLWALFLTSSETRR